MMVASVCYLGGMMLVEDEQSKEEAWGEGKER